MSPDFLPFTRPSIDEATIQAVGEVLRSGWITRLTLPTTEASAARLIANAASRPTANPGA